MTCWQAPSESLPESWRFEGRDAFRDRVRETISTGAREGWRKAVFCDADFADWPLGERSVEADLTEWAKKPGVHFTLLAQKWDETKRRHARFVLWRERFSHLIDCRVCSTADPLAFMSVLWSAAQVLHRVDPDRSVGMVTADARRSVETREGLDRWLRLSQPGFASTTLGL